MKICFCLKDTIICRKSIVRDVLNCFTRLLMENTRTMLFGVWKLTGLWQRKRDLLRSMCVNLSRSYTKRQRFTNLFLEELNQKKNGNSRSFLDSDFTKLEVFEVVCSLVGEKTPDPDGFPMVIYKKSWQLMKKEIMSVIQELENCNYFDWV